MVELDIPVPEKEAARIVGHSPNTLRKWRYEGKGPRFIKPSRRVLYFRAELARFLNSSLRCSTSDE